MRQLKLQTPVAVGHSRVGLSVADRIMILGSCFADSVGAKMEGLGLKVCINPFGTLYNPVSICNSVARMESGVPFRKEECVRMGSGSDLFCSFNHHTSFARKTEGEFLDNANSRLQEAGAAWASTNKVIITLGTAWCFEYKRTGEVVSNCLKIDGKEFERKRLGVRETSLLLRNMVEKHPDKEFIFTVSPIRHMADGAHGNQISKSTLLLAVEEICSIFPDRADYFPAYEIVLDELRDYRFYAPDMVHPSDQTAGYIWDRFEEWAFPENELPVLEERRKELVHSQHRPNNVL